jgi:hypothetical protein
VTPVVAPSETSPRDKFSVFKGFQISEDGTVESPLSTLVMTEGCGNVIDNVCDKGDSFLSMSTAKLLIGRT